MTTLIVYDNYEISPCRRFDRKGRPNKNGRYYEVCEPAEADVWTLYGHITGQGAEAIGDFTTRDHAEEVFSRIAGIPFSGMAEVAARLQVMHAGPKMLAALQGLAATARTFRNVPKDDHDWTSLDDDALEGAFAAIAEATGRAA